MTRGLVVMAYGTPSAPEQIEEYYTHIRRGRPPESEQLAELVGRYEAIGGISPLAERTRAQMDAIAAGMGSDLMERDIKEALRNSSRWSF